MGERSSKERMMSEQVANFIDGMIDRTEKRKLKWSPLEKFEQWEKVRIEVEKAIELDEYFIDITKSYGIGIGDGYVLIINIRYANAPIFSPALDKYRLIIKINDDYNPENLSAYSSDEFKEELLQLVDIIEQQRNDNYNMPDSMYEFFNKVLGEG